MSRDTPEVDERPGKSSVADVHRSEPMDLASTPKIAFDLRPTQYHSVSASMPLAVPIDGP
jgi:hypothetical protein